ncbi:PTS mannose transporter subunit IID [Spirochaetia bacterium]|nr:PTS mannose transporter subunit IID [Spirochaetia bacterium]
MEAVLYRIDERLIHGQVMVAWIANTGANSVVIVDEESSKDDFMIQVFQLAAPKNIKVMVADAKGFRDLLQEKDDYKAIVLFKGPINAHEALREVAAGELIVGNVSSNPQRKKYTQYAYFSENEKELLQELQSAGWKVNMQLLPDAHKNEFKNDTN